MLTTEQILLAGNTGTMRPLRLSPVSGLGRDWVIKVLRFVEVVLKRIGLASNWFRGLEEKDLLLKKGLVVKLGNRVVDNKPGPAFWRHGLGFLVQFKSKSRLQGLKKYIFRLILQKFALWKVVSFPQFRNISFNTEVKVRKGMKLVKSGLFSII